MGLRGESPETEIAQGTAFRSRPSPMTSPTPSPQASNSKGASAGTVQNSKAREARESVIIAAVACLIVAVAQLYTVFAATSGSLRSAAGVSAVLYCVLAWGLWARNSFAAGIAAFVLLSINGIVFLVVAIMAAAAGRTEGTPWMIAFVAFVAAWRALDGTVRIRRLASQK